MTYILNENAVSEIAGRVMDAQIDPDGATAFSLLNDDQAALLTLQIELALSQVIDAMRALVTAR